MQELSGGDATVVTTHRTCRDSLMRARLSRARETQDDMRARETERELQQALLRLNS